MQRRMKLVPLIAATRVAGTAAASAQTYDRFGNPVGWQRPPPAYERVQPRAMYYSGTAGPYAALNGTNHPTPSSTQGDVGPDGNNNGTLTGGYRNW
ncbi:hypothetical protein JJE66_35795 [Bradyrhizobium diazoefficiens]|uniref:hypothetical protein n=1 Tax=Bradyrhizobium diazoefficiens TaxID=1355477 RepID=UPI0019096077|nr:hypothetical protein [Bradyrhizobium diazoefficiens]MBK3666561.1 hypothetical protein [Bradyrhizobium diazoefficiens]